MIEKKTFEIWGWRPRICKILEINRTIYSKSERFVQFLKQNAFLTCSWRYLSSNTYKLLSKWRIYSSFKIQFHYRGCFHELHYLFHFSLNKLNLHIRFPIVSQKRFFLNTGPPEHILYLTLSMDLWSSNHGGTLCVEIDFTRTFQASTKCYKINSA